MSASDEAAKDQPGTEETEPAAEDPIVRRPFAAPDPTSYTTKGGRPLTADADSAGADEPPPGA